MNEICKDVTYLILMFAAVWGAFYLGTRHDSIEERVRHYDCRIVEFAPDIPEDVRTICRGRRIEQRNKTKE